jgi:transcriptional regulator with XRE-family HTH domain
MKASKDDKFFLKKLGERIAEIRKERNLKQTELAIRCGMKKQNMSRIEKGETNPSALKLKRISKELKVHILELFEEFRTNLKSTP